MAALDPVAYLRATRPFGDLPPPLFEHAAREVDIGFFPAGTRLPSRWTVIGTVRPPAGDAGVVVVLDGQPRAGLPGWDHFA